MKRVWITTAFITALLFSACGQRQAGDDFRLKKGIVVDGVNVSAMTVGEARRALRQAAKARLAAAEITLLLPEDSATFSAEALGADYDVETSLQQAARLRARGGERSITSALTVDEAALDAALCAYAEENESPPLDAAVTVAPEARQPVVYSPERDGLSIHRDTLKELLAAALAAGESRVIETPHTRLSPDVTVAALRRERTMIAQYATSFEKAPYDAENRVFNIQKTADAINGLVLRPGESFDCNAVLGDRAAAIRSGRYELEYGGGVCQVSSTLFNAVLMADLTILERHPHSWPMGYVEIGRDATISTGGKNFRFVNDSQEEIQLFVHADMEQKTVTASIYGAPLPEGMYIDVLSEKTGTLESAGETVMLDESLPGGTREVLREARDGKTSVTYKEYHASGGGLLSREVVYEDTYRAIDGLTYVSTDLYYGEVVPETES